MSLSDSTFPDGPTGPHGSGDAPRVFDTSDGLPTPDDAEREHRDQLVHAQASARRLSAISMLVVALVVALAVAGVMILGLRSLSKADSNGKTVDQLTDTVASLTVTVNELSSQLDTVRAQLNERNATLDAIDDCNARLSAETRDTNGAAFAALGHLVVVIAQAPPETRAQMVLDAVQELGDRLDDYQDATNAQSAWSVLEAEKQLPCPVA